MWKTRRLTRGFLDFRFYIMYNINYRSETFINELI